jgi:DNA-binding MarR family transcriptional regulator
MSASKERKPKKSHRINVILTENQFQVLQDFAEAKEMTMSEAIRELIRDIPMKKRKSID